MTTVLVISDLHVGSKDGLMPRRYENVYAKPVQKPIFRKWKQMVKDVGKIENLLINGDVVDGVAYRSHGKDLWTTNIQTQIDCAKILVKMIDYDNLFVTYGSGYHVGENPCSDQLFAKQMGAKAHEWEINLKPEGTKTVMNFVHEIGVSTSSWQYRATSIGRQLVALVLNSDVLPKNTKIVGRAHCHYYVQVGFTNSMGFVGPCWQDRTPYLKKKGINLIPKLGYILMETEDDEHWVAHPHTFDIVKPKVVS